MASYHCSVKVGAKGHACAHAAYISREGKYSGKARYEDLEATSAGNMPLWAAHNTAHFWSAADEHERANGATYREIEVALPREMTIEQRRALVEDFVAREIGELHAYQWAIHTPKAALEKGEQPHAHIMYSERTRDAIERDPEQYFKRYNGKAPARGGCRKDSAGTEERLQATRQRWAEVQNAHLELHGHIDRVDHRSLKTRGIARAPELHLGGSGVRALAEQDISALLEQRIAEGEHERAQRAVASVIDLSGDLNAARAERERRQAELRRMDEEFAREQAIAPLKAEYARALGRVTSETLATVPGLLPRTALMQALREIGKTLHEELTGIGKPLDLAAVKRAAMQEPGHRRRLAQLEVKEERARATLDDVDSMGLIKRMFYDTRAMTAEATQLLEHVKAGREAAEAAVEQSPGVLAAQRANGENDAQRRRILGTMKEMTEMALRVKRDEAPFHRPAHMVRLPESVALVVEKARQIAPTLMAGMAAGDIERMTGKAIEVAWKKPENSREFQVQLSRFVLPAGERVQQQEKAKQKKNSPGHER